MSSCFAVIEQIAVGTFVLLSAIAVMTMASLARGFLTTIRTHGQDGEPKSDPFPPVPVARTTGVLVASAAAIGWALAHLAGVLFWATTAGLASPRTEAVLAACYVVVSAAITCSGGLMLGRCNPYGRRVISWGQFLMGLMSFMVGVIALLLPGQEDVEAHWRSAAPWLLLAAFIHLAIDTAIGSVAQHVGKPDDFTVDVII